MHISDLRCPITIHPSIHCPIGVQCTLTLSLGEFPGYWGFRPCWCPLPFPSPSISWCFFIHSSSPTIGFHSSIFTVVIYTPRHQPSSITRAWDRHRATADWCGVHNKIVTPQQNSQLKVIIVHSKLGYYNSLLSIKAHTNSPERFCRCSHQNSQTPPHNPGYHGKSLSAFITKFYIS